MVTVIRRIDNNWAEGKLGERIGIFPISFVEVTATENDAKFQTERPSPPVDNLLCSTMQDHFWEKLFSTRKNVLALCKTKIVAGSLVQVNGSTSRG